MPAAVPCATAVCLWLCAVAFTAVRAKYNPQRWPLQFPIHPVPWNDTVIDDPRLEAYNALMARRRASAPHAPAYLPAQPTSKREHSSAESFSFHGFGAYVGYNFCLRNNEPTVFLPKTPLGDKQAESFNVHHLSFKYNYLHNLKIVRGPIPTTAVVWEPGVTLLVTPPWNEHIGHVWDGLLFVWHAHTHPGRVPFIDEGVSGAVFYTQGKDKYKYTREARPLVLGALHTPAGTEVPIYTRDFMTDGVKRGTRMVCMEKAVLPGMPMGGRPYMHSHWFSGAEDAEAFRSWAYYKLNLRPMLPRVDGKARVFVINRCPHSRCITNHEELVTFLNTDPMLQQYIDLSWAKQLQQHVGVMDSESLATQVNIMRHADVLIGVHGSGLTNGVFMQAGSSIIELLHPGLLEIVQGAMTESAGVNHHFFPTKTYGHGSACHADFRACAGKTLSEQWLSSGCRQPRKNCNVEVTPGEMAALALQIRSMVEHTMNVKLSSDRVDGIDRPVQRRRLRA